ncbi:hypothetical protein PF001_g20988 [Phytophthora fragariae]|uniref:Uncharacterized protein n=4 Tax=Phytophthora fragariae TaxID=53985 RepID=A0A6A4CBL7_9STRA|nr:hypothetical protein PF001_g20988 [Phytophthora fragariae]
MAKSREANRGAVLRRLRARLDRRTGGADAGADAQLRAQVDFYVRLRAALFANSGSTNVDAVDAVAVAALADDVTLPIDTLVHQAFPVSGAAKAPPSKKQRKSKAQDLDDDEPDDEEDAPEGEGAEAYELPLPAKCPAAIRRDIAKIIKQAAAQGKTPPRMAYPWVGQRACLNILELGFYDFLDIFENGSHDNLMWLGGKAALRSAAAKANVKGNSDATAATDLATLYRNDRGRYDAILARALDPYRVDEDGYQSISNLLEQTDALNPTKPPHLRLSDEALAHVVIDVTGGNPPNPAWVGNKSAGTWKVLLGDARIRALAKKLKPLSKKGQLPFPAQKAYDEDKEQRDDYSDFEDDEDMFTVLPPPPHLDEVDDGEPDELDESLPDAGQDQGDDEDQEGPEDVEDPRSAAPKPSDDDKASSAGDEGAATSSKKKSTPAPASPKSQVSFQSFLGTLR